MIFGIPSTTQAISDETFTISTSWFSFFQNLWRSTRAALDVRLGGVLNINTFSISNSGTSETDLISYTLFKNSLTTNGDLIEIDAWGIFASNANNKTVVLKFGSQTILTTGAIAANGGSWHISAKIIRTAATTQEILGEIISSNSTVSDSNTRTAGTQDLATDLVIKCTGTSDTASTDITQYSLIVKLTPYD